MVFDSHDFFLLPDGSEFLKNVKTIGSDMGSLAHTDNKKDILILNKGPAYGLDDTMFTEEEKYSINFTVHQNKFG